MTDDAALREALADDLDRIVNSLPTASEMRMACADYVLAYARTVQAATIEDCVSECEDRAVLNDSVEGETVMVRDIQTGVEATACGHRAIEARECAEAIRALTPELPLPPAESK